MQRERMVRKAVTMQCCRNDRASGEKSYRGKALTVSRSRKEVTFLKHCVTLSWAASTKRHCQDRGTSGPVYDTVQLRSFSNWLGARVGYSPKIVQQQLLSSLCGAALCTGVLVAARRSQYVRGRRAPHELSSKLLHTCTTRVNQRLLCSQLVTSCHSFPHSLFQVYQVQTVDENKQLFTSTWRLQPWLLQARSDDDPGSISN